MTAVTRTATIARPVEDVWAVLADFGSISRWSPRVDHSVVITHGGSEAEVGIGAVRRIQTGRMTLLERVVVWDEPSTLAYAIEGLPPVVRAVRNEWQLTPDGAGRTTVALTSTIDCGPRPPQQLIARIVAWRLARESVSMLGGLAESLEETP